ncbi:hemolysin III family protein [Victivallis sp. Marseille-Q1083]|uniref:PAQR family membrane homeostasis protein TrhA n=1 Tax=Victivallis sp. Marseille-Q1083 TaxID=2717288 RepID=UPI001C376F4B|nr:hemolysin III family protein [Victivallis sp. Marseille-Q1083]
MRNAVPEVISNFYSPNEEIANTITHAVGLFAGIGGLIALFVAALPAKPLTMTVFLIYGLSLLSMYLASTAYHAVRNDRVKLCCRRLDHCSIYLLIAGTYTPLLMLAVGGGSGLALLIVMWSIAAVGIVVKCFTLENCYGLSVLLYLAMGWLSLIVIRSLIVGLSTTGLALLVAGGLVYTFGIIFFLSNRPYSHTVWHLFVLCGSSLHFLMIIGLR